jgi:hypothetical protein
MPRRVLGLLLVLLQLNACSPRFVRVSRPELVDSYLQAISVYNSRVSQVKATVDIRGLGFLGQHFHERADIIAQKPHYLLWSMRSFFETPMSVIATNGEYITAYDFSAQSPERYKKVALKNRSVIELFDFRFHLPSLLSIILAEIPLQGALNLSFGVHEKLLNYNFELPDNWQVHGLFDLNTQRLTQSSFIHKQHELSYHVDYSDYVIKNGISFPGLYTIRAQSASSTLRFELRIVNLELNSALVDPAFFYLKHN